MSSPVLSEGAIDFTDVLMKEESVLFPYNRMGNRHGVTELGPEKMLNSLIWVVIKVKVMVSSHSNTETSDHR